MNVLIIYEVLKDEVLIIEVILNYKGIDVIFVDIVFFLVECEFI